LFWFKSAIQKAVEEVRGRLVTTPDGKQAADQDSRA
jgi:hypothetical protein